MNYSPSLTVVEDLREAKRLQDAFKPSEAFYKSNSRVCSLPDPDCISAERTGVGGEVWSREGEMGESDEGQRKRVRVRAPK